jgi:hypothetical protein
MIGEGWTDAESLEAIVAEVLAWGEQPEALFAVLGIAAVGWVEGAANHSRPTTIVTGPERKRGVNASD